MVRFACITSARRFGFAVTSNNTSVRMVLAGNHVRRPALPTVRRDPRFSRAPDRIDNEERAFLIPDDRRFAPAALHGQFEIQQPLVQSFTSRN